MKRYFLTAVKISFVVYLAILFILLFVRYRGGWWNDLTVWEYAKMHMNLIPFKTIAGYIESFSNQTMNLNIPLENLFGNLFMFLPMGIYFPFFSEKIDNIKKNFFKMKIFCSDKCCYIHEVNNTIFKKKGGTPRHLC